MTRMRLLARVPSISAAATISGSLSRSTTSASNFVPDWTAGVSLTVTLVPANAVPRTRIFNPPDTVWPCRRLSTAPWTGSSIVTASADSSAQAGGVATRLDAAPAAVIRRNAETPVLVKADQAVSYGRVVTGMVLLQQAGAQKIGFITDPVDTSNEAP